MSETNQKTTLFEHVDGNFFKLKETSLLERQTDPTKEEMMQYLKQEYGRLVDPESLEGDAEEAIYWFAANYHGGQNSNLYSALSTSHFRPGPMANKPRSEMADEMYKLLAYRFGGEPDIQEMSGTGGGGGGSGMTTTDKVAPITTPYAFKHPKDLPAHVKENAGPIRLKDLIKVV